MTLQSISELNTIFALPEQLWFEPGPGELGQIQIQNSGGMATIALQGAQVLTFQPRGGEPVLWLSDASSYAPGKSARGGIPICWPWFGPHPTEPDKPQHGFARTALWTVLESAALSRQATRVVLGLQDTEESGAIWPYPFALRAIITVGATLEVELVTHNPGFDPFTITEALHSYYAVGNSATVRIHGLDGTRYFDKTTNSERQQLGSVTIGGETDRVYLDTEKTCVVEDLTTKRRLFIEKGGSASTIVWNPWQPKARTMTDIAPGGEAHFVCIETGNALSNAVVVPPDSVHRLRLRVTVESLAD